MKHSIQLSTLALFFTTISANASNNCAVINDIVGTYHCSGECIVTDSAANKKLIKIDGEVDTISAWPESTKGLYQIDISKNDNGFRELEIGALVNNKMNTATAHVTDGQYPVLEEYTFVGKSKKNCEAKGYTKTVLNPTPEAFKSCVISCTKK
jgi:hypothetical protein